MRQEKHFKINPCSNSSDADPSMLVCPANSICLVIGNARPAKALSQHFSKRAILRVIVHHKLLHSCLRGGININDPPGRILRRKHGISADTILAPSVGIASAMQRWPTALRTRFNASGPETISRATCVASVAKRGK